MPFSLISGPIPLQATEIPMSKVGEYAGSSPHDVIIFHIVLFLRARNMHEFSVGFQLLFDFRMHLRIDFEESKLQQSGPVTNEFHSHKTVFLLLLKR